MSAPSRFVREAIARRIAAGLCPTCGAEMKKALFNQKPYCPNFNDGRHPQPTRMTWKKVKKMQAREKKK